MRRVRRFRRRILLIGLAVAAVVAGVGAPVYLRSVERDLEARLPAELAELGVTGISASFSGQEGVLRCADPLADPERVLDLAHDVSGVVHVTLDRSCRVSSTVNGAAPDPTTPPTTTSPPADDPVPTEPGFSSVGELLAAEARLALFAVLVDESGLAADLRDADGPLTVLAPTAEAFDALPADVVAELRTRPELLARVVSNHVLDAAVDLVELERLASAEPAEIVTTDGSALAVTMVGGTVSVGDATVIDADLWADNGVVHVVDRLLLPEDLALRALEGLPELVAVLRSGTLELSGSVPTEGDRLRLVAAAGRALAADNVEHDLVLDPDTTVTADTVATLVDAIEMLPRLLTTGSVGYDGSLFVRGLVVDADGRDQLTAALGPDAAVELAVRPSASAADIDAVEEELAEVLAERPLRFAPGTAELTDDAAATLDVLAAIAKRVAGMVIVVEGHTDTVGDPDTNLELSELRAAVVVLELASRGVPPEQLEVVGRGGADPVLVDGVEDRAASRRVEMLVRAAP